MGGKCSYMLVLCLSVVVSGRISLCGCLTVRVGDHKVKQDPRKLQDFKKQFQTSNFSAGEYVKWKRAGQGRRL